MPTQTIYLTGDQIGVYDTRSMSGNNNGVKVTLDGVEALGAPTDVFRVEIRQINNGQDEFSNGQFVNIYPEPDTDPPSPPLYANLNPQHDQFQGRASSAEHQIFTNPANIVFDVNGVTEGTMQYGPGFNPPRSEKLPFDAFPDTPPVVPCFVAGTRLLTARGQRRIDRLQTGDRVMTADHGLQPIRWIGARSVPAQGRFAPIAFEAGAIGNTRALRVSPEHRMLLRGWQAEVCFGEPEVLIAAKHLVNDRTIRPAPGGMVTYLHIVFDRHEIVFAEGAASESLHLGDMALSGLTAAARAEILALFPQLATVGARPATARRCLRHWETRLLAA